MMTELDEKLSAYLDGELDDAARAEIEALLAADPQVAQRLEALALANSDFVESADAITDAPASPALARQLAALHVAAAGGGNVVAFRKAPRLLDILTDRRALAACAALAVGALAVQNALPPTAPASQLPADGLILASSPLGKIFETAESGTQAEAPGHVEAMMQFSFANQDGQPCRVADLAAASGASRVVACRETGGWRVAVASFTARKPAGGTDLYQTASGPGGDAIETYLDAAMADSPYSADDEAALITAGWPTPNASPPNTADGDMP